jgi:peptidoglycan/LPS O-acetylase OafA/YrhL
MRETFHWALPRCIFGFFLGTLTYEAWRSGAAKSVAGTWLEVAALTLVVAFVTIVPGNAALEYLAPPLFCLVVLVFASGSGWISRVLSLRGPAALGRWSYSIYMVHTLVLVAFFSATRIAELSFGRHWLIHLPNGAAMVAAPDVAITALLYLAYLSGVVGVSALTWRFIEQPGQRVFENFARSLPRRAARAT